MNAEADAVRQGRLAAAKERGERGPQRAATTADVCSIADVGGRGGGAPITPGTGHVRRTYCVDASEMEEGVL